MTLTVAEKKCRIYIYLLNINLLQDWSINYNDNLFTDFLLKNQFSPEKSMVYYNNISKKLKIS